MIPALNAPELWRHALDPKTPHAHKYNHGSVLVWSGPPLATGAARLAATAALRAGAGLVTLAGERASMMVHAAHVTAIMLKQAEGPDGLALLLGDKRYNAVILGPAAGVGSATCDLVEVAMAAGRDCVLDADALTSFAGQEMKLATLIAGNTKSVVLTPHEGEFHRLMGTQPGQSERHNEHAEWRVSAARNAAALFGATIVLKGATSVIAGNDGRVALNGSAPPWLATAGSGDVLSGIIGGLLAQGLPGFEAACAGVWLHGLSGEIAGRGMIADDLALTVSKAVAHLHEILALMDRDQI
jgi:ADP-dependent NAD(P)H-hydrate dehydratase / NAD(P)H-hydrate epimerase